MIRDSLLLSATTNKGNEMAKRVSTHGAGRDAMLEALRNREPFVTGGAFSATAPSHVSTLDSGRLSGEDFDRFREDAPTIDYIVWSYATPIAWVTRAGTVYRVKQRFSLTTTKHQGMLYTL